ncbi:MAG: hydrogenase small subunit [Sulfurimonas sp.]|uniref:hydrogenase small subunit n=1 Tax=Sulfurimonas sp. TaxID=2022749 RepID=UPI002607653C|nr:hydrogenase small subunit [Sulfurimonas sp.]MDD2653177.1 hydrogenase small subunit [Sulfurimonas sp.]MDD3450599.1 hydrogenase small subunit [Sulfurimonas sp.]
MRLLIVGGGIAAVYLANRAKKIDALLDVVMLSDEAYAPYDRIHLCSLVDESATLQKISLHLDPRVHLELNQKIIKIDKEKKRVFSKDAMFHYDKLVIATGSLPNTPFDISKIKNAAVFRSADDAKSIKEGIKGREVVVVGAGPIALELLERLGKMESVHKVTLLVRSNFLYDKNLSHESIKLIENSYTKDKKMTISYEDEIIDIVVEDGEIKRLKSKKLEIENPFVVFGIGIKPNIDSFRDVLECNRGILTNLFMQCEDDIYAIGECAEVRELGFVAGHVEACVDEAECTVAHLLLQEPKEFVRKTTVDMLKVGEFNLVDVISAKFSNPYEKVTVSAENCVDEYFLREKKLLRYVGINSNTDIAFMQTIMQNESEVAIDELYKNRVAKDRGKLVCSCTSSYHNDLVDIVVKNGVGSFADLAHFSQAGRVCGRCRGEVVKIIEGSQHLIDFGKVKKSAQDVEIEKKVEEAKKRVERYNKLHPKNQLDASNLEAAMQSFDIKKDEVNRWISMVSANMQLHPKFEEVVQSGVKVLNKVPIIWLELADCSGNSEAFIKSANPSIEDLIFDYISLDYHELLMSASGDASESALEDIIKNQKGEYVLIVEGAVPLGLDGKYLRIGRQGETGIELLRRCAKDAALVVAVGSCAFDGGVVAAAPNPTGAVGVAEALGRDDVINISGCPTNPINIVGTLLYFMMFEEMPPLDEFNRPLWAYEGRIHDNCERRGHFEAGEFVKEWGDEGAKKGWCLFEMGCKGAYANASCPSMKFNKGTSWPVQAGHGCMACTERGFFDKYANERVYHEKNSH